MTNPTPGRIEGIDAIRTFVLASEGKGKTHLTLLNTAKDKRLTYRIQRAKDGNSRPWFVSVLTGSNNETDYTYAGCIWPATDKLPPIFTRTRASKLSADAPSVKAFSWFMTALDRSALPDALHVYHDGRCGCCNRRLTVPASVASGIGPVCAGKLGGAA